MASVAELTALYSEFMLGPRRGPGVCEICFDLTGGSSRCFRCAHNDGWLDAVLPISYSVAHEQLHHVLAGYKRLPGRAGGRFQVELAAVLWRFLDEHEACLAAAAGTDRFDLVTTIPSSSPGRDPEHPLPRMVGELVQPTRSRFLRLLEPGEGSLPPREFSVNRYRAAGEIDGRSVLVVDDTWTTGASARSAAATLRRAGATRVAALVLGRHVNRDYGQNNQRLNSIPGPFNWSRCALE